MVNWLIWRIDCGKLAYGEKAYGETSYSHFTILLSNFAITKLIFVFPLKYALRPFDHCPLLDQIEILSNTKPLFSYAEHPFSGNNNHSQ